MKVQNPLIGRVKGSAGGMTGCKMYDKNVLKAKAFEVNNPNTPAQQTQRTFFKEVEGYANQLTEEELKFLFPQKPKGMSRRSMLAKQLAEFTTTSGSVKSIDFTSLVTLGNAPTAKFPEISIEYVEESEITIVKWDNTNPYILQHANDNIAVLLFNISRKQIKMWLADVDLADGECTVPADFGEADSEELKAIIFNVGTITSSSTFGTLAIVNRPARKKSTQN